MDDIGADRDVDRRGNTGVMGRGENAGIGELESRTGNRAADRRAEADTVASGILGRLIEESAGLLGHPEAAVEQLRGNVFRGAADHRKLEIMDDRGAVGGDRRNDAVANKFANQRSKTDF